MRQKELSMNVTSNHLLLVCQEINIMEMNVSHAHCLAATRGVGTSSCVSFYVCVFCACTCVCTNYIHTRNCSLIARQCPHLCQRGRRCTQSKTQGFG